MSADYTSGQGLALRIHTDVKKGMKETDSDICCAGNIKQNRAWKATWLFPKALNLQLSTNQKLDIDSTEMKTYVHTKTYIIEDQEDGSARLLPGNSADQNSIPETHLKQ